VAARNLALSFVGFFQYLAPTITFLLAVFVYGETFTPGHAVAFTLIWIALALVSIDSLSRIKRASLR
jgi:chloramphenicol-sensitive protein RarD